MLSVIRLMITTKFFFPDTLSSLSITHNGVLPSAAVDSSVILSP